MKLNQQGIEYTLEIIRPKWSIEIISLLMDGTKRYSEICSEISGINPTTVTQSLQRLEKLGIIYKRQYPIFPKYVEYTLTERGKGIEPLLQYLNDWGTEYQSKHNEIINKSPLTELDFM